MRMNNTPANKCILRKVSSITLVALGITMIVVNLLQVAPASPLLGIGLAVLGATWLMNREVGMIALSIPATLGIQTLIGLTTGIGVLASVGMVWLCAIRFLEDWI